MATKLLDLEPHRHWQGGRALVPHTGPTRCVRCGLERTDITYAQPALFRHGGYGATDRITVRACMCGTTVDLTTLNPRHT